jgi:hypothetical protein
MADKTPTTPGPAPKAPDAAPKAPARSPDEIARDIAAEREGLKKSFAALGDDLSEAAETVREKTRERKEKVRRVAPIVGGAVVAALLGGLLLRRRRR